MACNSSTEFLVSLLRTFASFLNYFFKDPGSSGGETELPPSPPKTNVTTSTIVRVVMERAVNIDIIVTNCHVIRYRHFLTKTCLYQGLFQWFV